jgi:hypothetical protein
VLDRDGVATKIKLDDFRSNSLPLFSPELLKGNGKPSKTRSQKPKRGVRCPYGVL